MNKGDILHLDMKICDALIRLLRAFTVVPTAFGRYKIICEFLGRHRHISWLVCVLKIISIKLKPTVVDLGGKFLELSFWQPHLIRNEIFSCITAAEDHIDLLGSQYTLDHAAIVNFIIVCITI